MPIEIRMPALSPTMTEGTLARWLKAEGEEIKLGDVIAEIETDKATMEIEAADSGKLARILIPNGSESVAINSVIAILSKDGEDTVDLDAHGLSTPLEPDPEPEPEAALEPILVQAPPPAPKAVTRITVREALRDAMAEEMRADGDVFLLGEEVGDYQGAYKVSQGLLEEFGAKRVIDTPITAHGFAGLAIGAAMAGLKPIVEFMTWNFGMQAIDQIINSAAKTRYMSGGSLSIPIVFRGPNGAASRVAAQHSQDYSSWYAHCPGLKVVTPSSAMTAKGLLKAAIRDPNPVIFLENEVLYGEQGDIAEDVPAIGKAQVVREGKDVTITAFSLMVSKAMEAAASLADQGISAEVIDLRSLRPLDSACIIQSVEKTNRIVSVEEGWPQCGIGAEIAAIVMEHAFDYLDAPLLRVTGKDVPMPYAANLEKLALPQAADITAAAKAVCYRD